MQSLFDIENETPRGKQETAAAELTFAVADILGKAFQSRPDLTVDDLAERIGVTRERVIEILSLGDDERAEGNMYVVTLGRYLRAMGYTLKLHAVVAEDEYSPVANADKVNASRRRPRRTRSTRPGSAEREEAYLNSLPGVVYELLSGMDNGSLPFAQYLTMIQCAGFKAREAVQFMTDEANSGNMRIHDDGSISMIRD